MSASLTSLTARAVVTAAGLFALLHGGCDLQRPLLEPTPTGYCPPGSTATEPAPAPAPPPDGGGGTSAGGAGRARRLDLDLRRPELPAGVVAHRQGDVIHAAHSASSVMAVPGAAVYEDRGDGRGGGHWTFPGYRNLLEDPDRFDSGCWEAREGLHVYPGAATAPDGTRTATQLSDQSESAVALLTCSAEVDADSGTPVASVGSVWIRDIVCHRPTVGGGLTSRTDGLNSSATGQGDGWRRVSSAWGSFAGGPAALLLYPVGAPPDATGAVQLDPAATGSVAVWGAQVTGSLADLPRVAGSTGPLVMEVDAEARGTLVDEAGDVHLDGAFLVDPLLQPIPEDQPFVYFSMRTPSGLWSLAERDLVLTGKLAGQEVVGGYTYGFYQPNYPAGAVVRYEMYARASEGQAGLNLWVNGHRSKAHEVRSLFSKRAEPPSELFLGSQLGQTGHMPRRHLWFRSGDGDPDRAEGVLVGDSLTSDYPPYQAVGKSIYTPAEAQVRPGLVGLATPGHTVADQLATWRTAPQRNRPDLRWIFVELGINDLLNGHASVAELTASLQGLLTELATDAPQATLILGPLLPTTVLDDEQAAVWRQINQRIASAARTELGGPAAREGRLLVLPPWSALDDGTGGLRPELDSGDGLHINDVARREIARVLRETLVSEGLLP